MTRWQSRWFTNTHGIVLRSSDIIDVDTETWMIIDVVYLPSVWRSWFSGVERVTFSFNPIEKTLDLLDFPDRLDLADELDFSD